MSNIEYTGPSRLPGNVERFFEEMIILLTYSDPEHTTKLHVKPEEVIVHITPSQEQFRSALINNLLWINRNLKQRIRYSKSLAISKTISFTIALDLLPETLSLQK